MRRRRGGTGSRTASLHRALRWALVAGVFGGPTALAALFAACGGTTGREGLPTPETGSPDATLSDATADGTGPEADAPGSDASGDADAGGSDATTPDGDWGAFDVVILYADRPLPDVAAPPESGADGARDAAVVVVPEDGSACYVNNTPLFLACTGDAGSPCGHGGVCNGTGTCVDGGPPPPVPCTPTEQKFVDYSLDCYNCLVGIGANCLDNPTLGIVGQECEDFPDLGHIIMTGGAAGQSQTSMCLQNVDCILQTSCASTDVTACYCGTLTGSPCSTSGSPGNGACAAQEADGVGQFPTDSASVVSPLLASSYYWGSAKANAIFSCAYGNGCSACQRAADAGP